jgi:DNA replication protein DnaC
LLSQLFERTNLAITTNLSVSERGEVGEAKTTAALFDRLTRYAHILETGKYGYRFKASASKAKIVKRG